MVYTLRYLLTCNLHGGKQLSVLILEQAVESSCILYVRMVVSVHSCADIIASGHRASCIMYVRMVVLRP